MHPPLLDEAELASARRWYVDEFAKRSLIEVELEIQSFARAGQIGVGLSGMRAAEATRRDFGDRVGK